MRAPNTTVCKTCGTRFYIRNCGTKVEGGYICMNCMHKEFLKFQAIIDAEKTKNN
jgi:hypothetical protein